MCNLLGGERGLEGCDYQFRGVWLSHQRGVVVTPL